jgi:hypothetical protein
MAALAPPSDGTIERLLTLPAPVERDCIYESYFSKHDDKVERAYVDGWRYHEIQAQYAPGQRLREFQQVGVALTAVTAIYERDVRMGFAQGVLRSRMEAAIYSALAQIGSVKQTADKYIEFRKQISEKLRAAADVPLSKAADPFRFQLGYDLISDCSRVEISNSRWGLGVYHTRFVGALTGGGGIPPEALRLQASTQALSSIASVSLAMLPMAHLVETALTRPLSRSASATISTQQPTTQDAYARYNLSVAIQF